MIDIVKRLEALTVSGAAHTNGRAVKLGVIKGVHRLTVFKHNVVGNIHDVVDGANTCGAKTHAQPHGRGRNAHVLYDLCGIAVAEIGCFDANSKIVFYPIAVATALHHGGGNSQLAPKGSRRFARKTDYGKAIGAVRGDLKFHGGIVKQ